MTGDVVHETAPAKVNLILQVGAARSADLHPLCSLFASIDLADELTFTPATGERHEVVCPGIEGENLAARALERFEARTGRALAPLRIEIAKSIPVAAGLGGGSADAAAVLRLANRVTDLALDGAALREVALELGSDVPSQLDPGHVVVAGVGERIERVSLPELHFVLLPAGEGLSTAAVYDEADRIGATRESLEPSVVKAASAMSREQLVGALDNDLEAAAISLRPAIEQALAALRSAEALAARVTGSGPTCFGVFESADHAARAAARIAVPDGFGPPVVAGMRQNRST